MTIHLHSLPGAHGHLRTPSKPVKLILETKCPLLTAAVGSGPGLPLLPRLVTEAGDAMTVFLKTLPRTHKAEEAKDKF